MTVALHAEWIKLRSLRSTYLTMLCALALGTGLGFLDTTSVAHHWTTMSAQDRAAFDPVGDSFTGLAFAQLAFGVLGALAISTEYGTGMIQPTLAATPRRILYIAKALVVGTWPCYSARYSHSAPSSSVRRCSPPTTSTYP